METCNHCGRLQMKIEEQASPFPRMSSSPLPTTYVIVSVVWSVTTTWSVIVVAWSVVVLWWLRPVVVEHHGGWMVVEKERQREENKKLRREETSFRVSSNALGHKTIAHMR